MTLVGWQDYFNGRDLAYAEDLTLEMSRNAQRTIEVMNAVLAAMAADGVDLAGVHVASGWRPPTVNDRTANASHTSKHLTAQACDLADLPDRRLCRWALANAKVLWDAGVRGMERPQWTPTWLHLQIVPPPSGRFVFIPSTAAPIAEVLPGEVGMSRLT
jgi:hypothetical protein